ncbi:Putative stomatin/prohibitin-family membrane protease subunit YbbK [Streptococcus thermophilus]|nr:Putative stomatin/prohibitin-family membrane protease subunit YbbK [Streptococcus thermophilus]
MRLPFGIDKIAARIQLRLLQSEIVVETKTKDNVFVMMNVATQYRVNEQNVTDAYYKLMRPEAQIKSYIDALRSSVPKLTLDELFEKKDEIALEVQHQVAEEMTAYGYIIVKTLITKVEPDAEVKQSMNEINAAQRKRVAAQELAEADKIKIVTAAEAEKDRLHGVGIAQQRKAIVDGLAESIAELKEANVGMSEEHRLCLSS